MEALKNRLKNTHISVDPSHEQPQNPKIKHSNPIHQSEVEQVQSSISSLPTVVVLNILSRLPINTVGNCNCVCKSWYRAIHTPLFSTMQLKRAPKIKTLIIQDHKQCSNLGLVDIEYDYQGTSETSNNETALIGLNAQYFRLNSSLRFMGSCNGLLCLFVPKDNFMGPIFDDCIYVCNPLIGEFMAIPKPSMSTITRNGYGFGFDSAANEYKIVRLSVTMIYFGYDLAKPPFEMVAEVYTIGSGSGTGTGTGTGMWRNIGDVPYPINAQPSSAFVNGALHWLSDANVCEHFNGLIVSFDVAREDFRVVPHPPGFSHDNPTNFLLDLGVLDERLCLLDREFTNANLNIWVMKEYGVENSWTKQYVIRPHLSSQREELHLILLSLVMNEKILFLGNGKQLICYDPVKKKFSILGIKGLPSSFNAVVHEGSLISLRNLGEMMRVISTFQRKAW